MSYRLVPGYTGVARWKNFKLWYKKLNKKYKKHVSIIPDEEAIYPGEIAYWAWSNSGYYNIDGTQKYTVKHD